MNLSQNNLKRFAPYWATIMKIGESVGKILFLSPADEKIAYKKLISLAIERGEISVGIGSKFLSRIRLAGFRQYSFPEAGFPPPNFLASSLDLAVAELGSEKRPVIVGIPKSWAIIKTVEYPSSVLENLSEVMAYELDRITPFTPEKAYYDFKILKEEADRVFILIAAARSEVIDPYLKALREKEIRVEGITVNLLGLTALCRYRRKTNHCLFIEIDKSHYEGVLLFADNTLDVFSGSFTDESENTKLEQIETEIESQLPLSGQKDVRAEIYFYLKDKNPTLRELIKAQTGHSAQFVDESDLGIGSSGKDRKQIPYAAIGGILESLWPQSWGMNLFIKGFHRRSKPPRVITFLLVLALGILVGVYWTTPVEKEKQRLHNIEKQIVLKKAEVKKVDSLKKEIELVSGEINLISNFKQSKPLCLNILKELTLLLPKNSWLTRVRVFESQVSIEGYSPSATLLIPKLEGSKFFKKAEFAAPTFKDPRQNMDRFQIKMELKSP